MINPKKLTITTSLLWGIYTLIHVLPAHSETRGETLYSLHCKSCHTSKVHWREEKLATDWTSLKTQVGRWQSNIGLGWRKDEINDVAQYLNTTFYRFQITEKDDLAIVSQ